MLHRHLFVGGKSFGFWGGMFGVRADQRMAFYSGSWEKSEGYLPDTVQHGPRSDDGCCGRAGRWVLSRDAQSHSRILGASPIPLSTLPLSAFQNEAVPPRQSSPPQSPTAGSWRSCSFNRSKSSGFVMNSKAPSSRARRLRSSSP
jgi:hypothetical protein